MTQDETKDAPAQCGGVPMPGVAWCTTEDKAATRWCGQAGHEVAHERKDPHHVQHQQS